MWVCVQAADALADPQTLREVCRSQREHVAHALAMLGQVHMARLSGLLGPALLQRAHCGACSLQVTLTLTRAAVEWLLQARLRPRADAPRRSAAHCCTYMLVPPVTTHAYVTYSCLTDSTSDASGVLLWFRLVR